MAESWPASLEQKLNVQGYNRVLGNTVIATQNEVGLPKERRRFTRPVNRIRATIRLERSDVTTFENFYNTTLNGGIKTFQFNDPITDTLKEYKFDTQNPPSFTPIGANDFTISMSWIEIP